MASGLLQLVTGEFVRLVVFLWVLLVHIPRGLAGPNHANETAGVFEALAISGVALMVAGTRAPRSNGQETTNRRES
jgi:hypothetical protein